MYQWERESYSVRESEEYLRNAHMNSCSVALREHQTGSPRIEIARYIVDFRWFWIKSAAVKGNTRVVECVFISNRSQVSSKHIHVQGNRYEVSRVSGI